MELTNKKEDNRKFGIFIAIAVIILLSAFGFLVFKASSSPTGFAVYDINSSANSAPVLVKQIPDISLENRRQAIVNLSEYFADTDGDRLTYDYNIVEGVDISIKDNKATITLQEEFAGTAKLRFYASDFEYLIPSNEFSISFEINEYKASEEYSVEPVQTQNHEPVLVKEFENIASGTVLDLSEYFNDSDGDSLTYDYDVVDGIEIAVEENKATITPQKEFSGTANLRFYASDEEYLIQGNEFSISSANQEYQVPVESPAESSQEQTPVREYGLLPILNETGENYSLNHAPVLLKNIEQIFLNFSEQKTLNLSEYFSDEDGDVLTYDYDIINGLNVQVAGNEAKIRVDETFPGTAVMRFYASDTEYRVQSNEFAIITAGGNEYGLVPVINETLPLPEENLTEPAPDYFLASTPTQGDPILNSTSATNRPNGNLTCYNISTNDTNSSHSVKNIYSWYRNNNSILTFNMPFEFSNDINPGWTAGKVGNSLVFDGSNDRVDTYYLLPQQTASIQNITWSFWAKRDNTSRTEYVFGHSGGGGYSRPAYFTSTGNISGIITNNGNSTYGSYTTQAPNTTGWVHYVIVASNTTGEVKVYFNGTLNRTITGVSMPGGCQYNRIGVHGTSGYFDGTLDELMVYTRDLSDQEVLDLYSNQSAGLNYPNTTSLSAYFPLNESSGFHTANVYGAAAGIYTYDRITKDYSPFANNGTVYQSDWNSTGGYDGKGAYEFDSNGDYISVSNTGNTVIPANNASFTISLWFIQDSRAYVPGWYPLMFNEVYQVSGFRFGINNGSSYAAPAYKPQFWSSESGGSINLNGNMNISLGQWYHIAVAYTGNSAKMYLNGTEIASDTSGVIVSNTTALRIGGTTSYSQYLSGRIDDVQIYNYSLSSEQIAALYQNKTNTIVSQELDGSDVWKCGITPNDGYEDGTAKNSTNLTVNNTAPTQDTPKLNSTSAANRPSGNLTCYANNTADAEGDSVKNIFNWYRNETSIMNLNLPFEGGSDSWSTKDYAKGNNGFVIGALWNSTAGYDGKGAYTFDGTNDYIRVASEVIPDGAASYTATAWFKWLGGSVDTGNNRDFVFETYPNYALSMYLVNSSGVKLQLAWQNNATIGYNAISTTTIQPNVWYFGTSVYDGANIKVYVNGVLEQSTPVSGTTASTDSINIGTYRSADYRWFNGTIDEVRIYNYSLSDEQVKALYQNRTDLIVSQELDGSDVWKCGITPNDIYIDGTAKNSTNLTINNTAPTQATPILNSSSGTNTTTENLTCYNISTSDSEADSVKSIFSWYKNNNSIMVLNMPFEGGSTSLLTKDYSGYGNNGAVSNAVWSSTAGYDGKGAYEFNGNENWINIPSSGSHNNNVWTISAWFKAKQSVSGQPVLVIMNKDASSASYSSQFELLIKDNKVRLTASNSTNNGTGEVYGPTMSINQWYYVAGTCNGTKLKLYLNGTEVNSTNIVGCYNLSANIRIGSFAFTWTSYQDDFNGTIDDVRIYNYSLSAEQIAALYQNKTNVIVEQETTGRDEWKCGVTPNDGFADGNATNSSLLAIFNTNPATGTPILNSTFGTNLTSENLTCYPQNSSDADGDSVTNYYTWYRNGTVFNGVEYTELNLTDDSSLMNQSVLYYKFNKLVCEYNLQCPGTQSCESGICGGGDEEYDYSENNHTGIASSGAVYNETNKKLGTSSRTFSNASQVNLTANGYSAFNMTTGTISAWVYRSSTDNDSKDDPIFYMGTGNSNCLFRFTTEWSSTGGGEDLMIVHDTRDCGGDLKLSICYEPDIGRNEWTHVAVTQNSSGPQFYINGELCTNPYAGENVKGNWTYNMPSASMNEIFVGRWRRASNDDSFNGSIDDLVIWNRSLSESEIKEVYGKGRYSLNNTITSDLTSKNDVWKCGVTPYDSYDFGSSVNSSNLTITNSAPSAPIQISPANNSRGTMNNVTLVCSGSADNDSDTIYYVFYGDTTNGNTYIGNSTLGTQNLTTADGMRYYWKCSAYDGTAYSANSSVWQFRENNQTTQGTPVLNSSSGTNKSNENLTCYNTSTYDSDGDSAKNIISWYRNETPIMVLNTPFEGGSNSTWTKDYSGYGNDGKTTTSTFTKTINFAGITTASGTYKAHSALWEASQTNWVCNPVNSLTFDTLAEFTNSEYQAINSSNGVDTLTTDTVSCVGQRFKFILPADASRAIQWNISWKGWGADFDGVSTSYDAHLYIWNFTSSSWKSLGLNSADANAFINATINSGFTDLIDPATREVYLIAGHETMGWAFTEINISTDYVQLVSLTNTSLNWSSTAGYDGRGAYIFDGSQTTAAGSIPTKTSILNTSNPWTFSFWFNQQKEGQSTFPIALPRDDSGGWANHAMSFYLEGASKKGRIYSEYPNTTDINSAETTTVFGNNTWYHIVGQNNGTHLLVYVNGIKEVTTAYNSTIGLIKGNGTFGIDYLRGGALSKFYGTIDDVRVYNYSLSSEQISALYSNRTDLIVSQETTAGEQWKCGITPNDVYEDGAAANSSAMTIFEDVPPVSYLLLPLNATSSTVYDVAFVFNATDDSNISTCSLWFQKDGGAWNNSINYTGEIGLPQTDSALIMHLNEGTGTNAEDKSELGNNGTLVGASWNCTNAKLGSCAATFDGVNDLVNISDNDTLSFGNGTNDRPFSISVWAYVTDRNKTAGIVSKGTGAGAGEYYIIHDPSGTIYFRTVDNSTGAYNGVSVAVATLNENTWTHILGTYNGSGNPNGFKVYVNGVERTLSNSSSGSYTAMENTNEPLTIGRRGSANNFTGTIDEVLIWNRTLSATEAIQIYQEQKGTFNKTINHTIYTKLARGVYNWTVQCYDQYSNVANATNGLYAYTILNNAPTQGTPILNSTSGTNLTTENLTCYNQSTADSDGDSVKNIFNWYKNNQSIMVLNMPFEGGSNQTWTKDYALGNNGTVSGANWSSTAGYDGKGAYQFDGADDYTNITAGEIIGTGNVTVCAWIYPLGWGEEPTAGYARIVDNAKFLFYLNKNSNENNLLLTSDGGASVASSVVSSISLNTWIHVCALRNSNNLTTFYINATNKTNLTNSGMPAAGTTTLYIGNRPALDRTFNGTIDDLRIYNYLLTSEQISALYQNRTNTTVEQETTKGENWTCGITPNDGYTDGTQLNSSALTILNSAPNQGTPILNSTLGTNLTTENLTCYNQSTADSDGDSVKNIYSWYKNNNSIMVLNMPFEGGSNSTWTKDYALGNNGNVTNATWNSTGGYDGKGAYQFDGNGDYIQIADANSLDLTNVLTMSTWINWKGYNPLADRLGIMIKRNQTDSFNPSYGLDIANATGKVRVWLNNGSGGGNIVDSTSALSMNSWHYIAATYNGSRVSLYIDGVLNNSAAYTGSIIVSTTNLYIGDFKKGYNHYFNGTIDDVQIYNSSLSPEQISALYQNRTNTTVEQETTKGENWTCGITPNDGYTDGTQLNSSALTILNTAPTVPSLLNPANGTTIGDDTPFFNWTASSDNDTDTITYGIEISNTSSFAVIIQYNYTLTANNYTATSLSNGTYYWRVKAITSDANSSYSSYYYFNLDTLGPIEYLQLPLNGSNNTSYDVAFVFNATDDSNISTCSLWFQKDGGEWNNSINYTGELGLPNENLMLLMHMNNDSSAGENSTFVYDYSKDGNSGVLINGTIWNAADKKLGAASLAFDGTNDYVNVSSSSSSWNFGTGGFTLSVWAKNIAPSGDSSDRSIFGARFGGDVPSRDDIELLSRKSTNRLRFLWRDTTSNENDVNYLSYVWDSNWHHYVVVRNASTSYIYADGQLVANNTNGTNMDVNVQNGNISIGNFPTLTRYFNGTLDEIAIWNRTLSAAEVSQLYEEQKGTFNQSINHTIYTTLTRGFYNWTVQCYDEFGNTANATNGLYAYTILNNAPTQGTPILNSSSGTNLTTENLTCYNQSTADSDGDSVKNIYSWYKNNVSIMVLNMPFEGGSNSTWTKDYSGFGNNGTVTGAVWNSTAGYDGKGAYQFDGDDDYIIIPYSAQMKIFHTDSWAFTAWINPQNNNAPRDVFDGKYHRPRIHITNATNRLFFSGYNMTGQYETFAATPDNSITDNVWQHIAVVATPANYLIYINGVLSNSSAYKQLNTTNPESYFIGGADWAAEDFKGAIDEVRIYNYSLSDQQILALYQNRTNSTVAEETTKGENWTCGITPNDGYTDGTTLNSSSLTILGFALTPTNPDNASIIDRDKVSADADNQTLVAELDSLQSGINISFYANRTLPASENNVYLGSALSNTTGQASFVWDGTNSAASKLNAGNYTWWPTEPESVTTGSRYIYVYGGLNVTWKNNTENPNATYNEGDTVLIEAMIGSYGPESGSEVNSTYLAEANATLSAPNGTNYTVALVDPDLEEQKEKSIFARLLEWFGYK